MTNLIAYWTILYKEVRRFLRIWPQTLLPPVITTSLYFLIFGAVMGQRIGSMQDMSYMHYIIPGIVLMSVISNSYGNVVSSFYSTKFQRHIEELLVAPVSNWVILAGYVSGGIARGVSVGVVVLLISSLFDDISPVHPGIAIAMFVMTATLFSLAGFINAIFANSFDDISIIPNFVLTPLIYLGGVFYTIDILPEIWQRISSVNPILHMVNAFRYGIIGISDVNVTTAFWATGLCILILAGYSIYLLEQGTRIKS